MPSFTRPGLSRTEVEVLRTLIERGILVLDDSEKTEDRERLRAKLVEVHAEIERLDIDSRSPFEPGRG